MEQSPIIALRNRGCLRGLNGLGDVELLTLVIGSGNQRSAGLIAQELMDRFGDIAEIGAADITELVVFEGIGRAGALRLLASFELGRRCVISVREREITKVSSPEDVACLLTPEMKGLDREHFKAILLTTKNGILKIVTVAVGSLNAALVHPREIFKAAVLASAAGIIIVHNHPTGNPEPSREDMDLTVRFARCGELMGIELVDHIIIGGDRFVSMRERGLVTV
ncbi:MAG: DNA repair protein RadC [bacterium]|nr:MAG: DNA repair protein RadC [bacterium]